MIFLFLNSDMQYITNKTKYALPQIIYIFNYLKFHM